MISNPTSHLWVVGMLCLASLSEAADTLGIASTKPTQGIAVSVGDDYLVPYTETIPGTDVTFQMVPVPGGTFLLGSPDDEPGRGADEGAQIKVVVPPMWVGKYEVTQREYREFELLYHVFLRIDPQTGKSVAPDHPNGVSAPTPLYSPEFTYEYGLGPEYPAVSMTQYAAQQYTKWLSGLTHRQYRLPSEAEWEYACRAGSQGPFSWGNADAHEHAWHIDNAPESGFSPVGRKRPNPFGLHDMHGNVGEWTVNAYTQDGYQWLAHHQDNAVDAIDTIRWPKQVHPCVVRGGWMDSELTDMRSATRMESRKTWSDHDPFFIPSPWWLTTDPATSVGFRVFRSYQPLDDQVVARFWNHTSTEIHENVKQKLLEGHGRIGLLDDALLQAIQAEKEEVQRRASQRQQELQKRRSSRPPVEP